jgi:hypothetical protein
MMIYGFGLPFYGGVPIEGEIQKEKKDFSWPDR